MPKAKVEGLVERVEAVESWLFVGCRNGNNSFLHRFKTPTLI